MLFMGLKGKLLQIKYDLCVLSNLFCALFFFLSPSLEVYQATPALHHSQRPPPFPAQADNWLPGKLQFYRSSNDLERAVLGSGAEICEEALSQQAFHTDVFLFQMRIVLSRQTTESEK